MGGEARGELRLGLRIAVQIAEARAAAVVIVPKPPAIDDLAHPRDAAIAVRHRFGRTRRQRSVVVPSLARRSLHGAAGVERFDPPGEALERVVGSSSRGVELAAGRQIAQFLEQMSTWRTPALEREACWGDDEAAAAGDLGVVGCSAPLQPRSPIETLGSTTVICTDKTGTLTRNEMTVTVFILDGRRIEVAGAGYGPVGEFRQSGRPVDARGDAHLDLALHIGALCNDAKVEHADGQDTVLGDPTEAALIAAAEKAGWKVGALEAELPRVREQPFDSVTKRMVTVHRGPERNLIMYAKGSPSALLAVSSSQLRAGGVAPLTAEDRTRWVKLNDELAGAALRVLAAAFGPENAPRERTWRSGSGSLRTTFAVRFPYSPLVATSTRRH